MKVIVDTSVWSLALRRGTESPSPAVQELRKLIKDHRAQMLGPIRQEILSGIRNDYNLRSLKDISRAFLIFQFSQKTMSPLQDSSTFAVRKGFRAQTLISSSVRSLSEMSSTFIRQTQIFSCSLNIYLQCSTNLRDPNQQMNPTSGVRGERVEQRTRAAPLRGGSKATYGQGPCLKS